MEFPVDEAALEANPAKKKRFLLAQEAVRAGVGRTAAELRRRLFNRRHLKQEVPPGNLPLVQLAKSEHLAIRMDIVDQDARGRALQTQFDAQTRLEQSFRRLHDSITQDAIDVRGKQATLRELEQRLRLLQHTTHDPLAPIQELVAAKRVEFELQDQHEAYVPSFKCTVCTKVCATEALRALHEPHCHGLVYRVDTFDAALFQRCTVCYRYTTPAAFDAHTRACNATRARRERMLARPEYDVAGCVPEPPTELCVVAITSQSLEVAWLPPVFTGGLEILEYELCIFKVVREKFQRLQHRQHEHTLLPLPPVPTTRWVQAVPVAVHRFVIPGLSANTTYSQIAVRAKTENGFGGYSNVLDMVTTLEPTPPSAPLFLALGLVTMTSFTLSWTSPMDLGGGIVDEFLIVYRTLVQAHVEGAEAIDMSVSEEREFHKSFRAPDAGLGPFETNDMSYTFTIDGLQPGHLYTDVRVLAVTRDGVRSAETPPLAPVRTLVAGKEFKLIAELQEAINSTAKYIDSAFYNGFAQRYERSHYLQLLAKTIKSEYPALADRVDAMLPVESDSEDSESESETSEEDDSEAPEDDAASLQVKSEPPKTAGMLAAEAAEKRQEGQRVRRKQFQYRLQQLRHHIDVLAFNVDWADDRTTTLVSLIAAAEQRILDKQAELERAKAFKGPSMDSIVMHGGLQHFKTKELVQALEEEIDIEHFYISDTKDELRHIEDQKKADMAMQVVKQAQLAQRQAALEKFETDCEVEEFMAERGANALLRLQSQSLAYAWDRWRASVAVRRSARAKVAKVVARLERNHLRPAWRSWMEAVEFLKMRETCPDGVVSLGGIGLKAAHVTRVLMEQECFAALHQCREVSSTLQDVARTTEETQAKAHNIFEKERKKLAQHATTPQSISSLWTQGDSELDVGAYEAALSTYEKLLNQLPNDADRFHQTHIARAFNRVGRVTWLLRQYDKAMVAFQRAYSICERFGDPAETAVATRGMADCHVATREFKPALQLYTKSCSAAEDAADVATQIAAHHGMATCYRACDDDVLAAEAAGKATALVRVLPEKVEMIGESLDKLKAKLITVSAKVASSLQLERVGAIVPKLRRERLQCKITILEEEKVLSALNALVDEKAALLQQGRDDLKRSEASDATYVDSSVFLGISTRYAIGDFVKKLEVFMNHVRVVKAAVESERENAATRVANATERIAECEAELVAETGDLMRRVRGKDAFRCFRFNAVNAMYKDVLGHASGGVSTCIATVGPTVCVYDLHTGVCMGQAVGDANTDPDNPVHLGDLQGHTKTIMCVYALNDMVYTGGMDCALVVWKLHDGAVPEFVHRLDDFDAAVMSITATLQFICAGTADCSLFVFEAHTFARVAVIMSAHYRTITHMYMDSFLLATAGADQEIRLWQIASKATPTNPSRVRGHLNPVSCVQIADNEIVSGDRGGRIVLWDSIQGRIRREIRRAHEVAVTCLAFDTLRVISGDITGKISISDVVSGLVLQTLLGHTTKVLDVQVDRTTIVSCAEDGGLRQWKFQSRDGNASKGHRYHILGAGETLRSLSLLYHTSVPDLRRWNRIDDVTKMYMGQQLLVQKTVSEAPVDHAVSVPLGKLALEETSFLLSNRNDKANTKPTKSKPSPPKLPALTPTDACAGATSTTTVETSTSLPLLVKAPSTAVLLDQITSHTHVLSLTVEPELPPPVEAQLELSPPNSGSVILVYEMYSEPFDIIDGSVATSAIDDAYALSFVMPEGHIHLSEYAPCEKRLLEIAGANVYMPETAPGTISSLCPGRTYFVYVTEPASATSQCTLSPRKESSSVIALSDGRGFDSCTCIEGTPCTDEYGCRNWRQRFAIATQHGWAGFGLEGSLE
ncbi:hypothetical protein ACHHYP_15472 [Achlya hypogyna]|uniref:Fibronectin type-III domain-containing protein n=1 Tax=Achlya hypogyna TaxID=1202772 RepID=A0A1V9YAR8_ACHHY|nr:hypothetical protein ACHHYP_15472 [Achlya hypogyna]